jgi:hypothetical protein
MRQAQGSQRVLRNPQAMVTVHAEQAEVQAIGRRAIVGMKQHDVRNDIVAVAQECGYDIIRI